MEKIELNDRLFKGPAVFEDEGNYATLTYKTNVLPPLNSKYEINGSTWKLISITPSEYVANIYMFRLEKI